MSTGASAVRIGSQVRVRYADGEELFAMVGADSADPVDATREHVSPESPLGRALMGRQAGDRVVFWAPGGRMSAIVESVS